MKKLLISLGLLSLLYSCSPTPMKTEVSDNGAEGELIAKVDGCRIWRLRMENTVYFARCPEGPASLEHSYLSGKIIRHQYTIEN